MPDQSGKTVLITGANDGLGYHLTMAFAGKNAKVIMACRDLAKADAVLNELQMGVNYYGHYALVGRLMALIRKSNGIRIVTTSSFAEKLGRLDLDNPPTVDSYSRWRSYGDSKLAMLVFAFALSEKLRAADIDGKALCAHPDLFGGEYVGVSGVAEIQGHPKLTRGQKRAYDRVLQDRLWQESEKLTGVKYGV